MQPAGSRRTREQAFGDSDITPSNTNAASQSSADDGVSEQQRKKLAKLEAWKAKKRAREAASAPVVTPNPPAPTTNLKLSPVRLSVAKEPEKPPTAAPNLFAGAEEDDEEDELTKRPQQSRLVPLFGEEEEEKETKKTDLGDLDAFYQSMGISGGRGAPSSVFSKQSMVATEDDIGKGSLDAEDDDAYYEEFRAQILSGGGRGGGGEEVIESGEGGGRKLEEEDLEAGDSGAVAEGVYGRERDGVGVSDGVSHPLEELREKMTKVVVPVVNHDEVDYEHFRRVLYQEPVALRMMSQQEVDKIRHELRIKVRGKKVPRPVDRWEQCGLTGPFLRVLSRHGYDKPFAVQRQAVPAIMSGRDSIVIARTGSGKTLAYVLPLLRHVAARAPPVTGDVHTQGPLALILAPARELAAQLLAETRRFARELNLRVVPVFGGSGVADSLGAIRGGCHVVVGTPGRMLDTMALGGGKNLSLRRVTMVCIDEADRMFDLGFGPQVNRILDNVRPDRQMVLVSATLPSVVEDAAVATLKKPVEIVVGAKSSASPDIDQFVEVRPPDSKFPRLLQLLGVWQDRGKILIFMDSIAAAEDLLVRLSRVGYDALCLHGGKEQDERDATLSDFKSGHCPILVATGVAGRGIDIKDLRLVINYACPSHIEDYVHRIGRTGRAGHPGTAFTFIEPGEDMYAPDLVYALRGANQTVPDELKALAEGHEAKVKRGEARHRRSGFASHGDSIVSGGALGEAQLEKELEKRIWERREGLVEEEQGLLAEEEIRVELDRIRTKQSSDSADPSSDDGPIITEDYLRQLEARVVAAEASARAGIGSQRDALNARAALKEAQAKKQAQSQQPQVSTAPQHHPSDVAAAMERARAAAAAFGGGRAQMHTTISIPINSYPLQARRRVISREVVSGISEAFGCSITSKGVYIPPGRKIPKGQEPLTLIVEGPNETAVQRAANEIRRTLDDVTREVTFDAGANPYDKFVLDVTK